MITNEVIGALGMVALGAALLLIGTAIGYLIRDDEDQ